MYQISQVNPDALKQLRIDHQEKIREITGEPLDPQKAWQLIKKASNNFTEADPQAKEADVLFAQLLKKNGLQLVGDESGSSNAANQEQIRIRERERARAIEILKLKLQLAA